jgi:Hemerythrin HHE cation binding domain
MPLSNSELVSFRIHEQLHPSVASVADAEPPSEPAIVLQTLLHDHTELQQQVARLRGLCLALGGSQAPADPGASALVEEFAYLLIAHFAAEQASEFFEDLARDQPEVLQRVVRLQTEHVEIAAALGQVLEFCERRPAGSELSTCLTDILDMLDAHERAEKALIRDLVSLDERGGGE